MISKATFWQWFYRRWQSPYPSSVPGYTLLLPVPGDLPVFLKIALEVCSAQQSNHLVETIVVPDQWSPGFGDRLQEWTQTFDLNPVRLVRLQPIEQRIARYQNNPTTLHWLQLIRGAEAARTTHVLLHDADLFITEPDFMAQHYQICAEEDLACLGVSPVWDKWYVSQGIHHLTATWELMMQVTWLRSFQPWQHRGHDDVIHGQAHTFDTTLWPQCQTNPNAIRRHQREWGFVHFNYVISTYRHFQKSQKSDRPFEDINFRILLIRLLINAYDPGDWPYAVPTLETLIRGLTDETNPVTYQQAKTRRRYLEFRRKLNQFMDSGVLTPARQAILREGIQPFDQALAPEFRYQQV
ncbi:MAG: hypothetical protein VKK04_15375 [Synechococcales bacterium]|nr:hypothetical protein [Synechococcales bacterium]